MIRMIPALAAMTLLGACAPADTPASGLQSAAPSEPQPLSPLLRPDQDGGKPDNPVRGNIGSCGAERHQALVGQNRSAIPEAPSGASWRVTCTTCAMTMDINPRRMNILYDQTTGVIEQVRCG